MTFPDITDRLLTCAEQSDMGRNFADTPQACRAAVEEIRALRAALTPFAKLVKKFGHLPVVEVCHSHPDNPSPLIEPVFVSYIQRAALALEGGGDRAHHIVRIRVTSMWESCNRTTFYVELTTDEGFAMTPCGHATGSDYTEGRGLTIEEARDRAVTDAGTWGDFLRITPEPLIVDGVEIRPSVPLEFYTKRRALAERRTAAGGSK